MRFFTEELKRLKNAQKLIEEYSGHQLGVNKKRELVRLFYEISKREDIVPQRIASQTEHVAYRPLKKYLLERRFPEAVRDKDSLKPFLPSIKLSRDLCADTKSKKFAPKKIYVEDGVQKTFLAQRFKAFFPKARVSAIPSLKQFLKDHQRSSIKEYNRRRDIVFIVGQYHDFFKRCPCTKGARGCGYHIFNLGFGCIFDCTYCYLQAYTNVPGMIFPANIEDYFDQFSSYKRSGMRLGTGEFSDSLMLDSVVEYSKPIIDFFNGHQDVVFEFKTKSTNIGYLLSAKHSGNIVVSWSLNPQTIIDENEFFSASLRERLDAASQCAQAGYKIGFHFDPVIYFNGWQKAYGEVIDQLMAAVDLERIAWISLGTFRFGPSLKQVIEARFPANKILNGELLYGYDNKLRYPNVIRAKIYKFMLDRLKSYSEKIPVYLCMEDTKMVKELRADCL
ncbi:MAG: spore photoproduct lyase family protein [Candidatus Omnitrophota bacterium]